MKKIRLSKSCLGPEEVQAVAGVLGRDFLGMGKEVEQFEHLLAQYLQLDPSKVVCVNTGTSALHLALLSLDIGPGDEVLVPSITYVASLQAISATGATPVLCDVIEGTAFLDAEDAERRVTLQTKAIMPVHYASSSVGIQQIYSLSERYNLRVIEDAAHSFGSTRDFKPVGHYGDIVCFSFDGIKNITSGEGGAIVTSDLQVLDRTRDARLLGVEKDTDRRFQGERSWLFDVTRQGFRYHMSNIMAAIGIEQLRKIDFFSKKRKSLAKLYKQCLSDCSFITFLNFEFDHLIPHIFPVRIIQNRDLVMTSLRESGIECGIHYQPNHLLTYFKTPYPLPTSELLFSQLLSLPLHPDLSEDDVLYICEKVKALLR